MNNRQELQIRELLNQGNLNQRQELNLRLALAGDMDADEALGSAYLQSL